MMGVLQGPERAMADADWAGGPEILDLVHDSIIVREMDGTLVQWNAAAEAQYGWSRAEAVGHKLCELLPCDPDGLLERIEAELLTSGTWEGELTRRDRAGRPLRVDVRWSIRRGPDGRPRQVVETGRDVTEQRANEEAIRLGEYRFRNLFEAMAVAFWEIDFNPVGALLRPLREAGIIDLRGHLLAHPELVRKMMAAARVLDVNAKTLELFGATAKEQIVGQGVERFWPDESLPVFVDSVVATVERKPSLVTETVVRDLQGRPLDVLFTGAWSPDSLQRGVLLIGLIDIGDRKRAFNALERSEQRYRNLFTQMPIALWEVESSQMRHMFDELAQSGVTDFGAWVTEHPEGFEQARATMKVTEANDQTLELFGAGHHESLRPLMPALWPAPADLAKASAARLAGARSYTSEATIRTVDGREKDVIFSVAFEDPRCPESSNLVGAIDVTAQRRTTVALERSERRYRSLFTQMPIALWELDAGRMREMFDDLARRGIKDFRGWIAEHPEFFEEARAAVTVTEANDQTLQLFGAPDHETLLPLMPALWADPGDFAGAAEARLSGARSYSGEGTIRTVDGQQKDILFGVALADRKDPETASLIGAVDITERKRATAALVQSELKYRNLFHHMPIALCQLDVTELVGVLARLRREGVTDLDAYMDAHPNFLGQMLQIMRVEQVNEHMAALHGRSDPAEFVGPIGRFWQGSEDTVRRSLTARFAGAESYSEETRVRGLDGNAIDVFFTSAFPAALSDMGIGLVGMIDIRIRLEAEKMLQQVQADFAHAARVATLGELSASIAHEINQPLAAIATNGEASLRWLDRAEPNVGEARKLAARMVSDARRAADVIKHIRAMATRQSAGRERLSVNELIEETLGFLQRDLQAKEVRVDFVPAAGLPPVDADRTQLQQVMVNLAINAEQAMVQHGIADRRLAIRTALATSGCICVEVEDSGPGIPAELAGRLFDSFVTSKPNGLGIGLSICRSIIEAHAGRISVANGDTGARFSFTLPAAIDPQPTAAAVPSHTIV